VKLTRSGEIWAEWDGFGNTVWEEVLVMGTERVAYDERRHLCLNLDTGRIYRDTERMSATWESTPIERRASSNPRHFDSTLHRKRIA
jgi:hypothetical protein